jgi:hypothetical protein
MIVSIRIQTATEMDVLNIKKIQDGVGSMIQIISNLVIAVHVNKNDFIL